jgi:putative phosphoribosyl transferase
MRFRDRRDAGRRLAARVGALEPRNPVVVGLPRGGVPVAAEVARALGAPLDVLVVRKLGCPWHPELGIGAVGEGGVRVLNRGLIAELRLTPEAVDEVAAHELAELQRRVRRYRGDRPAVELQGRTVVIVDDGIATGFTARAAVEVARRRGAGRVVLAVPVAPSQTVKEFGAVADDVVCLHSSDALWSVGQFYAEFAQTSDDEVAAALAAAATVAPTSSPDQPPANRGSDTVRPGRRESAATRGSSQELADLRGVPLGNAMFTRDSFEAAYGRPRLVGMAETIDLAGQDAAWRCIYCDGGRFTGETYATDVPEILVRFWWCDGCGLGRAVSWGGVRPRPAPAST